MPNTPAPASFEVPPGSCDCHVHVFLDSGRYPFSTGRVYTPPEASVEDLLALQDALHLDRVVIVSPSVYGTDNSATLEGLRQIGPVRARGVAVIDPTATAQDLDSLHEAGIRGVRVNLETVGMTDPAAAHRILEAAVAQIEGRGWHLQIYAGLPVIAALAAELGALPVPVVLDHFAGADAALGVGQPGFEAVLDLVRAGKAYVKMSGAYRASRGGAPDYPQVAPFARALVAANPDRLVWGTDWPHPNSYPMPGLTPTDTSPPIPVDDSRLLDILAEWVSNAATRRKILVDNPARLYGF